MRDEVTRRGENGIAIPRENGIIGVFFILTGELLDVFT
jgi:hypothetical protein